MNCTLVGSTEVSNPCHMVLVQKLMVQMLNLESESTPVLTRFQEFIEYEDVLFHLLRSLGGILKTKTDVSEKFLKNLIYLLEHITMSDFKKASNGDKQKLFCCGEWHQVSPDQF